MKRAISILILLVVAACGRASPQGPTDSGDDEPGSDAGIDAGIDAPMPAAFDVVSAESTGTASVKVTFDAAPDATEAADVSHYAIPGLTVTGATVAGGSVNLATSPQSDQTYTVTVSGVTRESDHQALATDHADFHGVTAFDATDAAATSSVTFTVTFDAAPNAAQATDLANYTVDNGLVLDGTPTLSGNTVTIHSAGQIAVNYTVEIANVTRDSDGEPLTVAEAAFAGIPVLAPTVTNVAVTATNPDNGTTAFNTGTTTVTITGTDFETVVCPDGVALLDLDGAGAAAGTKATDCTVDSGTQITATFPAGIRTNGATGWDVAVTNQVATNATSAVKFLPKAGLLVSEVYTGTSGNTDHEYLELYNPTATDLDPADLGGAKIHLHVRNGGGTDSDKTLTAVTTNKIPSKGFFLFVSSASADPDPWFAHADMTYSAALVGNGGAYASLSATKDKQVLDKVGWGTQAAPGFEGTAVANIASNFAASRKPGLHQGHTVDSDSNVDDFDAPSLALTPRGTIDGIEPSATFDVLDATAESHEQVVVQFSAPPDPTAAEDIANYAIDGGVTVTAADLDVDTVTLTVSGQTSTTLNLTVTNVTRAVDALPLTTNTAAFAGRGAFDVLSAASVDATTMTVTFSDTPDPTAATTLANYSVAGLALTGTPTLAGNTVTITTATQSATAFTVTVTGVTRAGDGEPLGVTTATFTGTAAPAGVPTVTNVVVASTTPDNGATAFNTGTTTVTITGTDFSAVTCPTGVVLDDTDLTGTLVGTAPTACTIDSNTQITATFPAGIKTNGAIGWNVKVTNLVGTNATSDVKFVPRAGLLISEVMPGISGTGGTLKEFVEIYNPTSNDVDLTNLKVHVRSTSGAGDTNKTLTFLGGKTLPSHTFFMVASQQSAATDPWRVVADATYSATAGGELIQNGGVCLSLIGTANKKILDCAGWGTVGPLPIEGAATANIPPDQSMQRLPGAGAGAGTDTDNNLADFFAPSATESPKGTVSGTEP